LIVGCYNNFIFIPNDKFYFVAQNEFIALITFFIFCSVGFIYTQSIFAIVISLALSSFCEILYCVYLIRKNKLLQL
jgi:polysaccharide transporter, PST family